FVFLHALEEGIPQRQPGRAVATARDAVRAARSNGNLGRGSGGLPRPRRGRQPDRADRALHPCAQLVGRNAGFTTAGTRETSAQAVSFWLRFEPSRAEAQTYRAANCLASAISIRCPFAPAVSSSSFW